MGARRGSDPCSSPITNTASKLRVRARARSSTATRPGSPAASPRTVARSSAEITSSAWTVTPAARSRSSSSRTSSPRPRPGGPLRSGSCGRGAEPVGVAEHREHGNSGGGERLLLGRELEHRQRPAVAQLRRLLDRAVAAEHRAAAQSPLEEVDVGAAETPVRRPEEGVELTAGAVAPREAEQREQRLAEGGRGEPWPCLDRDRDAERAERRLDRRTRAIERRADDRDLLGRGAAPYELEHGLGDELEGGPTTGALEEADRAVERGRHRVVVEEVALEVRARAAGRPGARRELDDVAFASAERSSAVRAARRTPRGRARTEARRAPRRGPQAPRSGATRRRSGPRTRRRRPARRSRRRDPSSAARPRAAAPCRGRRRPAAPARRGTTRRAPPARERGRGVEEARLDLGQRTGERVGEAREARRRPERSGRGRGDDLPQDDRALCLAEHPRCGAGAARNANSVSNVPTVPASSAPFRPASSRSTRSTSTRFGTISQGSRSRASTNRSSRSATLPACAGPTTSERPIEPIVVAAFEATSLRSGTSPQSAERAAARRDASLAQTASGDSRLPAPVATRRTSACGRAARRRCRASCPRSRHRDLRPWRHDGHP